MLPMKWLLVVIVLRIAPDAAPVQEVVFRKTYISEVECHHVGRNFRQIFEVPADRHTTSICIPENWFEASDWQMHEAARPQSQP